MGVPLKPAYEIDGSRFSTLEGFYDEISRVLIPGADWGHNLDAFNDCMRDVVAQDYGWAPTSTGLALVFVGYDAFAVRRPRTAHLVLDIVADHSRQAALYGRRLICLVQSDDPEIRFEPVGATGVRWNDAEWLDSTRRSAPPC